MPPWYLSTAMTCFAGFTYVNASRGRLEALLYHRRAIKYWTGTQGSQQRSEEATALFCASNFYISMRLIRSSAALFNQCEQQRKPEMCLRQDNIKVLKVIILEISVPG